MKNKKVTIAILLGLLLILFTGVFFVVFLKAAESGKETPEEETPVVDVGYFSAYTKFDVFKDVPAFVPAHADVGTAEEQGGGCYTIDVNGTTVEDYKGYLSTLESAGFTKHSDNGEDAMEGYVYTASYTKDNLTVTVAHAIKLEKTYVTAAFDLPLSDRLVYKDEYVADNIPGAKTKVHLVQLNNNGNSFVIQLKNGHFVVHDGGLAVDAPYLLDYLESLTPEGEKPVIEGWFISHAHGDHEGAPAAIATDLNRANRLIVEAFYFVEPSKTFITNSGVSESTIWTTSRLNASFKNLKGERTAMYRPQFGQRYYFCDMAIDVAITPELFPIDTYYTYDFNESSIWLMHRIEGQRFLIPGDSSHTGMKFAMNAFDEEYFYVDVFAVSHHGINVYDYFVDFCVADTLLYTDFRVGSLYEASSVHARLDENARMQELAKESYAHGDGTVVLTFPYTLGTAETMPSFDWRYNGGEPKRTVFQ